MQIESRVFSVHVRRSKKRNGIEPSQFVTIQAFHGLRTVKIYLGLLETKWIERLVMDGTQLFEYGYFR